MYTVMYILKKSDKYLKNKSTVVEDLKEICHEWYYFTMLINTMLIKDSSFLDTLQIDKNEDKDKSQVLFILEILIFLQIIHVINFFKTVLYLY